MNSTVKSLVTIAVLLITHIVAYGQAPTITSFSPASGSIGMLITINGTNLNNPKSFMIGSTTAIVISNNGSTLVGMVMPGTLDGLVSITTSVGNVTSQNSFTVVSSVIPNTQQGNKLLGTGAYGNASQGYSVAISADGNTAIVGGNGDNNNKGALWAYTRNAGIWTQQGNKLIGTGAVGNAGQGTSIALSADGNTAIVAGISDSLNSAATWVFIRNGGVWMQQGGALARAGALGSKINPFLSAGISADGNTAIVGGYNDNGHIGAAWIYTRVGSTWTQQGSKLVGTGAVGYAHQGYSVGLSADGNTAIIGGVGDNSNAGAAWVFTRSGVSWIQQGSKLTGTGLSGYGYQGCSVALNADGNTAIVGGYGDNIYNGAAWVYTRTGGTWSQQGNKLVGTGAVGGGAKQGTSVSLSADGNIAMVVGPEDFNSGLGGYLGAIWVFTRSAGNWTQQGNKYIGAGAVTMGPVRQGFSVAMSADGNTAFWGGYTDNNLVGGAWAFGPCPDNTILLSSANGTDNQSICINTAISNITYNITGATGATITGLPSGVSGTLASNVITISGTPPTSGTYNFTITLTGGCGIVSKTGTIIVKCVQPPTVTSFSPASGPVGSLITINGTNLYNSTILTVGGTASVVASNNGTTWVGMIMPGTISGSLSISTEGGTTSIPGTFTVTSNSFPSMQQGSKLVGTGAIGNTTTGLPSIYQGSAVAVSADGNTAIVGAYGDNGYRGAVWVYTRSGGTWSQQGNKLVGTATSAGLALALSADGNTAVVGASSDNYNPGFSGYIGAAMVFVRNGGVWTQQGNKLVGTGATGSASQGQSVGLTADGNTVFVGGSNDNSSTGAVWVYSRSGGTWTQQGSKLVAPGLTPSTYFGRTVASSADGNTIIIGGYGDNSQLGAAWIYTRTGATWIQQGNKLVGTGAVGSSRQGGGVAISADGNTTVVAGPCDNSASGSGGAFWVYTRTGTSWTQQGNKLVVTGVVGNSGQGGAIALSADGNNLIMGGPYDDSYNGATWLFTRAGGFWTQKGSKLVGTGAIGDGHGQGSYQGVAVAISADGSTAIVGGETDNSTVGATWVFAPCSSTASANAISLSSAAGTDGQSICTNAAINTVTYQTTGAIGANESGLPAGVTGSWASNVATISGTPTASGTFNYSVTLIGGCGGAVTKMGTIKVAPCVTGLNQIDDPRTEVKISPNPSDGSFSIELNSNEGLDISIKNIQGQEVYHSFNNTLDRIQVNLDKPAKGLYFLHLQNERGVITKKIVLQ